MKVLALLKLIEDGYDIDYLLCNECAEGGCDIGCECRCHILAIEKKRKGRQALVELLQKGGRLSANGGGQRDELQNNDQSNSHH